MPATSSVSVNLLGNDNFSESPIGRIVAWAITYGRYIMITTEIIVLLAFISRFSLDRKLSDLNESIGQKQAIIESNLPFEEELTRVSTQLTRVKTLMASQNKPFELLQIIKSILPMDATLSQLTITTDKISAITTIGSTESLAVFMNNLQSVKQFVKVDIGEIKKLPIQGVQFQFTVSLTQPVKASTQKQVQTTK
jgi:Tfp pilus assembly protein PilN